MRPFRKGQRLISLCDQKTRREQQVMSRYVRRRNDLVEEIKKCEEEIRTLESLIASQQLNAVLATKAEIFVQRRQQVVLLHQRQQLKLDRTMSLENLQEVEQEIKQCQLQLASLKRKEIKFTKWTDATKKEWLMQRETTNELEQQESVPWRYHPQ